MHKELILFFFCFFCLYSCNSASGIDNDFIEDLRDTIVNGTETLKKTHRYRCVEIFTEETTVSTSRQGIAILGDSLFQFYDTNNQIDIYDLNKKELVATISLKAETTTHCNNIDFSNIYYNEDDIFPLVYVEERGRLHRTVVYRIMEKDSDYKAEKIQTINFTPCSWCTTTLDDKGNYMWVYYSNDTNGRLYSKIKMPDLDMAYKAVNLDEETCLENIPLTSTKVGQDATVHNGFMYHLHGYSNEAELRITDLKSLKENSIIDLTGIGFRGEPEGISFWNNTLLIVNSKGTVYKLIERK